MGNAQAIEAAFGGDLPPGITGTNERCTILVTNLNPDVSNLILTFFILQEIYPPFILIFSNLVIQRIDEDKLFNLFSIYGNIVRIKILRSKPDHALVQMGDGFQAELAVHFLKVSFMHTLVII